MRIIIRDINGNTLRAKDIDIEADFYGMIEARNMDNGEGIVITVDTGKDF